MSILKPHQLQLKTEKMDELGFSNLPEGDVHNHRNPTESSIDDCGCACCREWRVRIEAKITKPSQTNSATQVDVACQWEDIFEHDHGYCVKKLIQKKDISTQHCAPDLSCTDLTDKNCRFYTGINLPAFLILVIVSVIVQLS